MRCLPAVAIAAVMLSMSVGGSAQQLELKPVNDYFDDFTSEWGEDKQNKSETRYVARRCGALVKILTSTLIEDMQVSPSKEIESLLDEYAGWTVLFITMGTVTDPLYESDAEKAEERTLVGIVDIEKILIERMNQNMAMSGSLYAEDMLIRSDLNTCRLIAEAFSGVFGMGKG